ncbi:hypothetical protein [Micromonospora sp. 4G55]|uniref:hypothetical protein n=1 Tax=Micromonospora sp. 4G55 TaxID=2806102 RepID=UPI001A3EE4E5|nr:hypothetical protein [Micromonospora sp. 4G55]MBM0256609.1 hypothetical protein [Micromonospora sp. 4G55]MBM0260078.1 hypothetical protein [Micromonospora sp. 4G55]
MSEDREGDDRAADEEFKVQRHDRFGKLPPRVGREEQVETTDTEPPHEEPEEPPVRREWG